MCRGVGEATSGRSRVKRRQDRICLFIFGGKKVAWLVHKLYGRTTFPILTSYIEAFSRLSGES